MPKVGLRYLVAAKITEETPGHPVVYEPGMVLGRAISMDITYTRSNQKLYADDMLAESENTITGGTMTTNVAEILDEARVAFFGIKRIGEAGSYTYRQTGAPTPYCGIGYLTEMLYKGKITYYPTWIYKSQFAPQGKNAKTRAETTEYQTVTVTGDILGVAIDANMEPIYADEKVYNNAEEAIAWLNQMANIAAV